jgi:hypothetical protein
MKNRNRPVCKIQKKTDLCAVKSQLIKKNNIKFMRMKKFSVLLVIALLSGSYARAQKYEIVMKLDGVEKLRFLPDSVERMRLETPYYGEKKVGVTMKGKPEAVYGFSTACVFTRVVKSPDGIPPVAEPAWTVRGEKGSLEISFPGGVIGRYGIYDLSGRLVREGSEAGDRATVDLGAGGIYIVRIGDGARRVLVK